jgi:hypothetical protein
MSKRLLVRLAVPMAALATFAACSQKSGNGEIQTGQLIGGGTEQIADVKPVGGFLPNPSLLTPGTSGQSDLVYRDPTASFPSYNKVILEPVTIWAGPTSTLNDASPSQREALANTFHSDLYNALSKHCHMVTRPPLGRCA